MQPQGKQLLQLHLELGKEFTAHVQARLHSQIKLRLVKPQEPQADLPGCAGRIPASILAARGPSKPSQGHSKLPVAGVDDPVTKLKLWPLQISNEFFRVLSSASPHHCPLQVQHTVRDFQVFFSFNTRGFLETEHEAASLNSPGNGNGREETGVVWMGRGPCGRAAGADSATFLVCKCCKLTPLQLFVRVCSSSETLLLKQAFICVF